MKAKNDKSITAIAEKCGVSAMTVSRALRGSDVVKEATRKKVLEAAESLGYIRNPLMGRPSPSGGRDVKSIEIIIGKIDNNISLFHSLLLSSLERQFSENGYDCIVRTCDGDYKQFVQLLESVRCANASATMIVGSFQLEQLSSIIDIVPGALLIDNPGDISIKHIYESFCFDNVEAARLAVSHLLECNRCKILLVTGSEGHFFSKEIEQGYRETLSGAGIDINEEMIVNTDFTADCAYEKLKKIIDSGLNFDAVFTNDEMASGVYRALFEHGRKIPEDVAVMGCDGVPVGMHLFPRLSTVKLDYDELARRAVRHMLHERDISSGTCRMRLLPKLEIRESSAI